MYLIFSRRQQNISDGIGTQTEYQLDFSGLKKYQSCEAITLMIVGHATDTVLYLESHSVYNSSLYKLYMLRKVERILLIAELCNICPKSISANERIRPQGKTWKEVFLPPQIFLHSSATFCIFHLQYWDEIHESTISFRFTGIIFEISQTWGNTQPLSVHTFYLSFTVLRWNSWK